MLKDKNNSLLTSRGNVTVDKRTNTLLIQDIDAKIAEVRDLLKKLDVPVRQVEISTQIVSASSSLEEALGLRIGGGANVGWGHRRMGIGAGAERARAIADAPGGGMPASSAVTAASGFSGTTTVPTVTNTEGIFANLSQTMSSGGPAMATVGLSLARLPNGTLLDLELQALEFETSSKTIARPTLVTMDQTKASVSKGQQIPYQEASSSGATSTSYKEASLKLDVTPHITIDDKISLDLDISNDSVGTLSNGATSSGPPIDTNHIQTKVLVNNGETIVLGGIFKSDDQKKKTKS